MGDCGVAGCGLVMGQSYCGQYPCQQNWGGAPGSWEQAHGKCYMRGYRKPSGLMATLESGERVEAWYQKLNFGQLD